MDFSGFQLECEIDESGSYKTHIYPSKVSIKKVDKFPEPITKKQLQQFLGLVNVFKSWSTKLTAKSEKIRQALEKGINYKINKEIKEEFKDMKKEIMDARFIEPYDPKKKDKCSN